MAELVLLTFTSAVGCFQVIQFILELHLYENISRTHLEALQQKDSSSVIYLNKF